MTKSILGINGLGRIGKLTLWHHIGRKHFSEIIVNLGRKVGKSLQDVAFYIEHDSTYGRLHNYLYGYRSKTVVEKIDESNSTIVIDGIPVKILTENRNPKDIGWDRYGARLVVDTTGKFLDPTLPSDVKEGSVRGHLDSGAYKAIVSAPFKIKDRAKNIPDDSVTVIMGINEEMYDSKKHLIISGASCTTTCLAHMMKPLLDYFGAERILSVSMATVHAVTSSQQVLDRVPKTDAKDLRKIRSAMNNIILTSTGAAKTLALVLPEMKNIGFIAQSVRVPVITGSLIILVLAFKDEESNIIDGDLINKIYRDSAERQTRGYLLFTDDQKVSTDIIGFFGPAAIIEGSETHTRTAMITLDISRMCNIGSPITDKLQIPVTQAVIYGWYDNELGSYTNMLGDLTVKVAEDVY
ncbi:MAG TPA: glyceraldehyde 3-phosphate dehydrogenase NAD-binding domain-containing protein [Thermodesulfovibrio thiophilus]|nr:glyceraldehyde 3-phosphate dehydrogenase NAD-binding domain-containing protein [Thermodesulfovibrio thiophilus]